MLADLLRLLSGSTAAFMALLMLRAGLHKVRDLARFEGVLTDYDLANGPVVKVLRLAVPTLEIAAAATLCLATTQAIGAALAGGLLLVYAAAMAAALARGRSEIDCGCGGPPALLLLPARLMLLEVDCRFSACRTHQSNPCTWVCGGLRVSLSCSLLPQ